VLPSLSVAWLARMDARARRWPLSGRWSYIALKWTLVALGAFLWIATWWQRHVLLGLAQIGIVGYGLARELGLHLPRHRGGDPADGRRDTLGTP
jgi:hypothetical protein